jgi:hypothetical protein
LTSTIDTDSKIGATIASGGIDPDLGIPKGRPITLRIVSNENEAECNFWVGLFKNGTLDPSTIMDLPSIPQMFIEAATKGVTDSSPLMLTDSFSSPPKYLYLLPTPTEDFRERAIWIGDLVKTAKSWSPKSVGFYLAPDLLDEKNCDELIQQILRELIFNSDINDFYLLVGEHGLNSVLKSAIQLKHEFDQEKINLFVFH